MADGATPHNTTSTGAVVRRGDSLLLVRLTYGPTEGRYSFPGGLLGPGEELDTAAAREALEETGVTARCAGVIGLRTRADVDGATSQTDVIWLLEHVAGEPAPRRDECDDARYLTFDEIAVRDDVEELVRMVAERLRSGKLAVLRHAGPNTDASDATPEPSETWRLFL